VRVGTAIGRSGAVSDNRGDGRDSGGLDGNGRDGEDAHRGTLWSIHGRAMRKSIEVSGEVAGSLERTFASLRVARKSDWSLFIFHAPSSSSLVDPLVDVRLIPGEVRGAVVAARRKVSAVMLAGRLLLQRRRVDGGIHRRRQTWMSARRVGRSSVRWELSLYNGSTQSDMFPGEVVADHIEQSVESNTRLRAELQTPDKEHVRHRIRVDYLPGGGDGVMMLVGTRARLAMVELEWRLSAYSLERGQAAFVSRPGVGPFELFSGLYGRGTDLSLRLRAQLGAGLRVSGYYGRPHLKPPRAYLGLEYVR
jgi:hypothetical protein